MNKRKQENATLRRAIDNVQTECDKIRNSYPLRYPVPPEVDDMLNLEEQVLASVRDHHTTHALPSH